MERGNLSLAGRRPVSRHAEHVYPCAEIAFTALTLSCMYIIN